MKILITGATSGIAYEVAKELIKKNHKLYLTAHTIKEVVNLRKKLKQENLEATCLKLDILTDINIIENLEIDVLWNHIGIGTSGSLLYTKEDAIRDIYEVNVFKNFELIKKAYHKMLKQNHGKIFITSSLIGMYPLPFLEIYSSSKIAISQIVKTLEKEQKTLNSNIKFSLIEPGAYPTGYNEEMIENIEKYTDMNKYPIFYNVIKYQKKLFLLLESNNTKKLVRKITKEIEKENPKKILRIPKIQGLLLKLYFLTFC